MRITFQIWWESNAEKPGEVVVKDPLMGFCGIRRCSVEEREMGGQWLNGLVEFLPIEWENEGFVCRLIWERGF